MSSELLMRRFTAKLGIKEDIEDINTLLKENGLKMTKSMYYIYPEYSSGFPDGCFLLIPLWGTRDLPLHHNGISWTQSFRKFAPKWKTLERKRNIWRWFQIQHDKDNNHNNNSQLWYCYAVILGWYTLHIFSNRNRF